MTTRSIFTEIIYSMSATKNISDALATFGIADADTTILAVLINDGDESKAKKLSTIIHGQLTTLNDLAKSIDTELIKKVYKISNKELEYNTLLNATVGKIAAKEFISL